ncbi:hypothetical protein EVAR_61332_1 [Eumeta japonica]|uniref:Uncharacterized protein n=1 Tax=Eumeta variegata TaxID=151549 RepID=A0A4C1Y4T5_EUMVA|nr:hypothetical protein EVAR_61332_1 [Eumeta japonica]
MSDATLAHWPKAKFTAAGGGGPCGTIKSSGAVRRNPSRAPAFLRCPLRTRSRSREVSRAAGSGPRRAANHFYFFERFNASLQFVY